jgi:hypothetical protein
VSAIGICDKLKHIYDNESYDPGSLVNGYWVRIMADYSTEGVWDRAGRACSLSDLPISKILRKRLLRWQAHYEESDDNGFFSTAFDLEGFSAEGLQIAICVKRQLPDWSVMYFDEMKFMQLRSKFGCEREILLADTTR